jgi:RNA polymerase sigma-70 factor (ECF subfamily)
VVLKDVFDFSIEEIADMLSTSSGAIKAALHRGRGKLVAPEESPARAPSRTALDAFCAAFNARDIEGMTAVLLEGATVEIVGVVTEYGTDAPKDPYTGSFAGTLAPITFDERGGVPPQLLEGYLSATPRCEVRAYRGGWILLFWYEHDVGPIVRTVMHVEVDEDRIAHVRNYFFTPEVIAEVCTELGVPYRVNGYRYWRDGG